MSPGLIKIGFGNVGIFDNKFSRSIWEVSGKVIFRGKCNLGHGTKISVGSTGILTLGSNFTITAESSIVSFKEVTIGNNCLFSWDNLIMDTDFHSIKNNSDEIINFDKEVIIEDNVWIGCRCLILKGSFIPSNSIIGANTVINSKFIRNGTIIVGNPAKIVRTDVSWEK